MFSNEGGEYIYILTNPSFPGLVKIGRTDRDVEERIRELSGHTGVPTDFQLFQAFSVSDSVATERAIHVRLDEYRLSANREFFSIEPEVAAEIVSEYALSRLDDRANVEREDELLAEATALANRLGKVWPSLLGSSLSISFSEARQILTLLHGRGIIDSSGTSVRHRSPIVNLDVQTPAPDESPPSGNYTYPSLSDLMPAAPPLTPEDEETFRCKAEQLLRTCAECSLDTRLGEIHVGSAVTRYEVVPEGLIRLEVLAEVQRRLSDAFQTRTVRVYPMIEKGQLIGAELPNDRPRPFGLRAVLESEDWISARATVPIALGELCGGRRLLLDLHQQPHLLVVGKEGAGRTELLNAIIGSILFSKSPRDVRLILVDPTAKEWNHWNRLPQLVVPVVNDPQLTLHLLLWLNAEIEQRRLIFAAANVDNLVAFNLRQTGSPPPRGPNTPLIPSRLPHLVVVINEIADAMLAAGPHGTSALERLIQNGGPAGVNIVLGTQRTSGDVLTQSMKDGLRARVCMGVASGLDSMNVLGIRGAENLIGDGDMLVSLPNSPRLYRAQAAVISKMETASVSEQLSRNGPPWFVKEVWQSLVQAASRPQRFGTVSDDDDDSENGGFISDDDALYRQALAVLMQSRRASVSMFQRRLRIGFNTAGRIMQMMEDKGIVGPDNGSSAREILVDLDRL